VQLQLPAGDGQPGLLQQEQVAVDAVEPVGLGPHPPGEQRAAQLLGLADPDRHPGQIAEVGGGPRCRAVVGEHERRVGPGALDRLDQVDLRLDVDLRLGFQVNPRPGPG
jgi:hypothetical protein